MNPFANSTEDEVLEILATKLMGWRVHPRNTAHWMETKETLSGYRPMGWTCGLDRWNPCRNIVEAFQCQEAIEQAGLADDFMNQLCIDCMPPEIDGDTLYNSIRRCIFADASQRARAMAAVVIERIAHV